MPAKIPYVDPEVKPSEWNLEPEEAHSKPPKPRSLVGEPHRLQPNLAAGRRQLLWLYSFAERALRPAEGTPYQLVGIRTAAKSRSQHVAGLVDRRFLDLEGHVVADFG